jgi:outer membrane lipoprotein LolB
VTRWPLAVAALVALAACHTVAQRPPGRPPAEAVAGIVALGAWQAQGRVAVRSAGTGFSASFDWQESGGDSELDVRGPLGGGAARITQTADTIRIESGAAPPLEAAAPFDALEGELVARLGFPLPITALRYWLLGAPAPDRPSTPTAQGFEQDGWAITLEEFAAVDGAPAPLPSRLTLLRGDTRIRVAVSHWRVGPS